MQKTLLIFLFIFVSNLFLFAQEISNVDFTEQDNRYIIITYDLQNCNNEKVDIKVKFISNNNEVIIPKNLTGDLNKVTCGSSKKITWDVKAEREELKGQYQLVLTANSQNNKFKEVKIGKQIWMAENLNVDKFRNGDPIPEAKTPEEWKRAGENKQAAWCYYNNDSENGKKYGKLYNWYAVNDARGLAPKSFHIPNDLEWTNLINNLGGESVAGKKMKSTNGWKENGNGTNESGFNALPGGNRNFYGAFSYIGYSGYWWSSTEYTTIDAWYRYLDYGNGNVGRYSDNKKDGFSVRCLRD
jgi:uncharacterized protein (TIGR02145 family)